MIHLTNTQNRQYTNELASVFLPSFEAEKNSYVMM